MWPIIFISLSLVSLTYGQYPDCKIQVLPNDNKFKVYLKGFLWGLPLDKFNGTKHVISNGESVTLTCKNGFIQDRLQGNSYTFVCSDGKFNKTMLFEDLLCRNGLHRSTKTTPIPGNQLGSDLLKCEEENLAVYRVSVKKPDGSLKHVYTVCLDKLIMRTKFVFQPQRNFTPSHAREQRRDIWGFDFFGRTVKEKIALSDGYIGRIQRRQIANAFPKIFSKISKYPYTFSRGHLAPFTDFQEPEEKKTTCQYLNAAPQWSELKKNSWSSVELWAQELIKEDPLSWEIYTGTYGLISSPKGYLFLSPALQGTNSNGTLPIPKLFWKLVHNLANKTASRVFIGVNNPLLNSPKKFTEEYLICEPKANEKGVFIQGSNSTGFTYECDLDEFLEKLSEEEGIVKLNPPTEESFEATESTKLN